MSDQDACEVYQRALKLAEEAGLIVCAYGGIATIATPDEQRKAGVRESVLCAIQRSEP